MFNNIKYRPDVFPGKWHCKNLSKDDVAWAAGSVNQYSQLLTKSTLNSCFWPKVALINLVESYGEKWNFGDQIIISVWDKVQNENESPVGFVSFDFVWYENRARKISDLTLKVNLVWVRPDKRGLGGVVARHVISHFVFYLLDCNLRSPFVSRKGLFINYYADFYSIGGDKVSKILEENLAYIKEAQIWKVGVIEIDVGY
jgi:hypothetical protein